MAVVRVQTELFDLAAELAALVRGNPGIGGVGSFIGLVRGEPGLISLTLEHYPGMTEAALSGIAQAAMTRFNLIGVTIIHRVGTLCPGDPIVLVLAAASHRADALAATGFLIDWLKTEAPFWKKEELTDGARWVEARESDREAKDSWK